MSDFNGKLSEILARLMHAKSWSPVKSDANTPSLPGVPFETASGPCQMLRQQVRQYWSGVDSLMRQVHKATQSDRSSGELEQLGDAFPDRLVYLDLETCGFAGSPIFLVGIIHAIAGELMVSQYLARDYSEERAILDALVASFPQDAVLVTFNGKSFDWPMTQDRLIRHRLPRPVPVAHIDMLHLARRRWKQKLPNCKLQTIELYVCRRRRVGDLGGRDVAVAYHEFVRSARVHNIRRILHHNALDLLTLLQLTPMFLKRQKPTDPSVGAA